LPSFNWRATGKSTAHKPRLCNLKSTGSQTTRPWASSKANLRSPCVRTPCEIDRTVRVLQEGYSC
jgi:hypothetical protein